MDILLVNDDSIYAPGIITLAKVLKEKHNVTIIAPEKQMSGTSHCITFYGYLNYEKLNIIDGVDSYILKGTPADCVKFGIDVILKGKKPDVVLSGINKGFNIGTDILYSGTANAALEGAIFKVKSIALSQEYHYDDFTNSANFVLNNLEKLMDLIPENDHVALNINFPTDQKDQIKGVKMTLVGENMYADYYEYVDQRGYAIRGNPLPEQDNLENTDVKQIRKGYITISFIKNEFNDFNSYEKFKDFKL